MQPIPGRCASCRFWEAACRWLPSRTLGAPFAIAPMVDADNNQHAPNENLRIGNLWYGIEVYAVILALVGEEDGANPR